jgi:D-alanyl-D-alanine carboxypeptidase (penicillin-binding protein 5/6)
MAVIARYALNMPEFVKLINTQNINFRSSKRSYSVNNANRLLREYEGATGVKTGFTGKAGHCFVGAATRGDMQLISVVLGSGWGEHGKQQKWKDTKAILNYGFENIKYQEVINGGEHAADIAVQRSRTANVPVFFEKTLTLPLSAADKVDIRINAPETVAAPVKLGETLGTADVYINDRRFASVALVTEAEAARHDFYTSLKKVATSWFDLRPGDVLMIEEVE